MREALTPMFRQYNALKQAHPNAILLFRMGDFYEMFHDDAKLACRLLELTLTARGKGTDNVVPMCGFPYHQLDPYVVRLVQRGERVAICEQVENPKQAKGLVRREVVRVVTPGTVNDPAHVDAKSNVWLAAVTADRKRLGAALLDVSTGEFLCWEQSAEEADGGDSLVDLLRTLRPAELVHPEGFEWNPAVRESLGATLTMTAREPYDFSTDTARAASPPPTSITTPTPRRPRHESSASRPTLAQVESLLAGPARRGAAHHAGHRELLFPSRTTRPRGRLRTTHR